MEQRHITGKSHWYHETQSSTAEYDVLPLVPEAAKVSDPFLLDVILDEETLAPFLSWLVPARVLAVELFPDPLTVTRSQPLMNACRRPCRLLRFAASIGYVTTIRRDLRRSPGLIPPGKVIIGWHKSRNMPANWLARLLLSTTDRASI